MADIDKIEATMKQLVIQQLGDKSNFDSTLNDLEYNNVDTPSMKHTGPNANGEKPLERLIKEALDYDSVCYKQALGMDLGRPNGVTRSQEFEKMRKGQQGN